MYFTWLGQEQFPSVHESTPPSHSSCIQSFGIDSFILGLKSATAHFRLTLLFHLQPGRTETILSSAFISLLGSMGFFPDGKFTSSVTTDP